jgi:hypothetical protein
MKICSFSGLKPRWEPICVIFNWIVSAEFRDITNLMLPIDICLDNKCG